MAGDQLNLDLDPRKVIEALKQMSAEMNKLADTTEEALGRQGAKSVDDFTDHCENGSNKVAKFFSNLGTRIKDDLKSAFDVGAVMQGAKFSQDLMSGVKQVFDMERAFDRLNTRIGLSGAALNDFKRNLGQLVAATGTKLQDVMPGVESAAARGGIKDPKQLAAIGEALGRVKATTGEDVTGLSDSVIEIMKNQGLEMNSRNYRQTIDAVQGTRTSGAFKTAGEASSAIEALSPYGKANGLDVRQLGGLAAQASTGGKGSEDILRSILEKGSTIEGRAVLNSTLGTDIFKNGKLDVNALKNINGDKFGNEQIFGEASGLSGANGADLKRFAAAMKNGDGLQNVVQGANETAKQFDLATDNFASALDRFKEKAKEAGREVGSGLSQMAMGLVSGDSERFRQGNKNFTEGVIGNAGTIAEAAAATAVVGVVTGGALKSILGKIGGGAGGALGGALGGAAADAAGIQKVFVVNMGSGFGGDLAGAAVGGGVKAGAGALGKLGGGLAAAAIGAEVGQYLMDNDVAGIKTGTGKATDNVYDALFGGTAEAQGANRQMEKSKASFNERNGTSLTVEEFTKAVHDGTLSAMKTHNNRPPVVINPSRPTGTAVGQ